MSDLNEAIKQFEAVEANLVNLEMLWKEIDTLLPGSLQSLGVGDPDKYRELAYRFDHIRKALPKINGVELTYCIYDPDEVVTMGVDYHALDDFEGDLAFMRLVTQQEEHLRKYRFEFGVARRSLARQAIGDQLIQVEHSLASLRRILNDSNSSPETIESAWERLASAVKAIEALLGATIARPPRWQDLKRHIRFRAKRDYDDIVNQDWPAVKEGLEKTLYGEHDPIPTTVKDLGDLVASKPAGPIATKLQWDRLTPADFERLLFVLVSTSPTYVHAQWLTATTASDRGRDVSVWRVKGDSLVESRRERIVIACKHQKSVGFSDISLLCNQMEFWDSPRVDELIIATTGRFSTDAIQWVEKHNLGNTAMRMTLWPESELERLLSFRPDMIAEFKLR